MTLGYILFPYSVYKLLIVTYDSRKFSSKPTNVGTLSEPIPNVD